MGPLMAFWKFVTILWPFIKEAIIKNTSVRRAIEENRLAVFLFTSYILLFVLACYLGILAFRENTNSSDMVRENTYLHQRVEELETLRDKLRGGIQDRNDELDEAHGNLSWFRGENDRLREVNDNLNVQITTQAVTISDQRDKITGQQSTIDELQSLARQLQNQLDNVPSYSVDQNRRQRIQERLNYLRFKEQGR